MFDPKMLPTTSSDESTPDNWLIAPVMEIAISGKFEHKDKIVKPTKELDQPFFFENDTAPFTKILEPNHNRTSATNTLINNISLFNQKN